MPLLTPENEVLRVKIQLRGSLSRVELAALQADDHAREANQLIERIAERSMEAAQRQDDEFLRKLAPDILLPALEDVRASEQRIIAASCVYFVYGAERVKIGWAAQIENRMTELRRDSPVELTLLARIPEAGVGVESFLHRSFKRWRERGEWFTYSDPINRLVAALPEAYGPI